MSVADFRPFLISNQGVSCSESRGGLCKERIGVLLDGREEV